MLFYRLNLEVGKACLQAACSSPTVVRQVKLQTATLPDAEASLERDMLEQDKEIYACR
jgi:hypothetical protein